MVNSRLQNLVSYFCVGCAIVLFLNWLPTSLITAEPTVQPEAEELRGVWLTNIDSNVLFSQDNLSFGLQRLQRLQFNTVYPTVWNWGYTLYPSATAEAFTGHRLDPHPGLQGRDMLLETVQQGHDLGLGVIPWFEFGFMAPAQSDLAQLHPDWLTQRQDGSQIVMEGQHPRVWLNPFHPDAQNFIQSLVLEIVQRYDVEGIQFDDHFGLPSELGYDAYTVALYQQEHAGQLPAANAQDPEWLRWRAAKLSAFMGKLSTAIKQQRPDCLISLSPNPYEFAYTQYLQDWRTWVNQGWVDELIVQVYRSDEERFIQELGDPILQASRERLPVSIGILAGLKHRIVPMSMIANQVGLVRQEGLSGVSFFFYETLGDRDLAFQELFQTAAKRPTRPNQAPAAAKS